MKEAKTNCHAEVHPHIDGNFFWHLTLIVIYFKIMKFLCIKRVTKKNVKVEKLLKKVLISLCFKLNNYFNDSICKDKIFQKN